MRRQTPFPCRQDNIDRTLQDDIDCRRYRHPTAPACKRDSREPCTNERAKVLPRNEAEGYVYEETVDVDLTIQDWLTHDFL